MGEKESNKWYLRKRVNILNDIRKTHLIIQN